MKKTFLIIFLLIISTSVFSKNIYLFGSLGMSNYNISDKDTNAIDSKLTDIGFSTASTSTTTDNLAYKVGLGINFPVINIGIESSYVNYGKIAFKSNTTVPTETLNVDVNIEGIAVDVTKTIGPISFAAGLMNIDDSVKINSSQGNVNVPIDDILIPKIGINLMFNNIRFEYSRLYFSNNSNLDAFMFGYVLNIL